jgi:DNA polymerase-4
MAEQWIIHVDIDAFFAAVEQVLNPELRGRPVIVGGGVGGRGVIASASYEARPYGLHAGMPMHRARELCPDGVYLTGRHEEYNRFSERVFDVLAEVSPAVEQTSLDEACLSLKGCERLYGVWSARPLARLPFRRAADGVYHRSEARPVPPAERVPAPEECRWVAAVALWLKRLVRARTGLDISVGVGTNKLVAKVASDFTRPDGLTLVREGREADFMAMRELKDIPGIGRVTREKFRKWNVRTVEEARRLPADLLEDAFGAHRGRALHELLRGEGSVEPSPPDRPKSISRETTFWRASNAPEFVEGMLFYLTERLGRALRREGMEGRTVQVKVRYGDRLTVQRSRSLGEHTDRDEAVFEVARRLLRRQWRRSRRVRLVGVGLTDLRRARAFQHRLFDDEANRGRRIDRCLDRLRERFGFDVVQRGPAIRLSEEPEEATELPDISAMMRR